MKVLPGNLFVKTENPVHYEKLKEEMLKICKEYKMDYGIIIGGFKSSYISNSPMVRLTPISVVKIDVKTGKETSINGFNIPSTSILRILDKIIKIGDDPAVYNSYNASCVSPSILIEELELKENKNLFEKPPIIK